MISRLRVIGHSMEPILHDGDYVIVHRFTSPKLSDIVAAKIDGKILIKRIVKIADGKYFLSGDNQHDKKIYVAGKHQIMGKLFLRVKRR